MNQKPLNASYWNNHHFLVALCVLTACLLRFWAPSELAFINDELSTWNKVDFDSVGAVIQNIKLDDSHPVGIYVFLYYWTGLFGTSQLAIKLPFALMSVGSMWFVYQISRSWFNQTAALLVLAYFCTLQYPIWWAAIARQYQSGLFLTLGMVYFWTQWVLFQKRQWGYWLGFVLMGTAAMYNHYFSLLFAALVGLTGLFWIKKEQILPYIGAGVLMIALFAPHIPITTYQISYADGHRWYNVPTFSFLPNHLAYIFHYSVYCGGMAVLLSAFSLVYFFPKNLQHQWKKRLTAIFWFAFPLLFGYYYSVYQSPILRTSHLLFSFPYLLFFLFSFFEKEIKALFLWSIVGLVLLVNILTLVLHRKHYQTMNSHPYKPFVVETKAFLAEHTTQKVGIVLGENPVYLQYYKETYDAPFEHTACFRPHLPISDFRKIVQNPNYSYLIIGSLPPEYVQMAMDNFPYVYKQRYGINFEYYILGKKPGQQAEKVSFDFEQTIGFNDEQKREGWRWQNNLIAIDSNTVNFYYNMSADNEWGPTLELEASELIKQHHTFIDVAIDVRQLDKQPLGAVLVIEFIDNQGESIKWFGQALKPQQPKTANWQRMYASMRLVHSFDDYETLKNSKIKIYFWNKTKQALQLDRFSIKTRKGNPILYKDTNPFNP